MHNSGPNIPKKGAGYFANRLKEKGLEPQEIPKESTIQADAEPPKPKYGQIFEESTKSIATMTGDMNETARLVSSMKEGLERVSKAASLIDVGNPLCDPFGSCTYTGMDFTPKSSSNSEQSITLDELSASMLESEKNYEQADKNEDGEDSVSEYATVSNLKFDANSINEELQEFKDNIKQKETDLVEFRTKLNQARLYAKEFANADFSTRESNNEIIQISNQPLQNTEFDVITSNQSMNVDSLQDDQDLSKLSKIRQEVKNEEKKLFEIRWKTKKAESEYEDKRAAKEELEDIRDEISKLEEKRNNLRNEVKKFENQNREPKQELRELEQKIERAKKEYEDKRAAKEELEDARAILGYLKLDKDAFKSDLEELKAKIKKAESEYEEKRAAKEELEDARLSVSILKAEKETLATDLEELRSKIKKAESEYEEKRAAKEELGEFNAALTHLKLEKELLVTEQSDLKIRIKKAESEYEEKKAANESLADVREILAYLKPERDYLKTELNHLRNKIERLEENYDEINSRKREIQTEYDDLKHRFKKLESEYDDKKNSFRLH